MEIIGNYLFYIQEKIIPWICFSLNIPKSVEVLDEDSKMHTLSVKVLGAEETWQTPSLLLATEANSGGKVVFSQVIYFLLFL